MISVKVTIIVTIIGVSLTRSQFIDDVYSAAVVKRWLVY